MQQSHYMVRMNFKVLTAVLLLLCLKVFNPVYAQTPRLNFKKINNENGLSNSTVETIFQDSRGFMWFGTRDGLNRFDGYQMLVFKYDPSDSNSVSDSYITSIYEDENNFLWIGTLNGLNRYDPVRNRFKRFYNNPGIKTSLGHNHVTKIAKGPKQNIWIATGGAGIYLLEPGPESFTRIKVAPSAKNNLHNFINTIYVDKKDNVWAGTEAGLYQYNPAEPGFNAAPMSFNGNSDQPVFSIRVIKEDNSSNLLLGTSDNGLIIYDPKFRTQKLFVHDASNTSSISSNLLRDILITRQGKTWTGTVNGGLDYFDPLSQRFTNYQYQPDNPASLSQRTVSALFEDNQGNIWIGTHRGGVNLYVPGIEKFNRYRQMPNDNSLSYNDVKSFCEDRYGNIWIGTDGGGLNLFDRKKNTFRHYKYDHQDKRSIGSNEVIDITEDREGNLWIGTWGGGLCQYERGSDHFIRYRQNGSGKAPLYIQNIFEDSKSNLWIATYFDGLFLFNRKDNTWKQFDKSHSGKTKLSGKNILSITEDKEANVWIGTDDGGLNRLDAGTGEISHYFSTEDKKPDIRILFTDSKANLWVGQSGLFLYNKKEDAFFLYDNEKGLAREFIKGIAEDNKGNLWISTSNGITLLNAEKNNSRKYNMSDGLQDLEFEANAFLKTTDGQLFFGGINGFNAFYPNEILSNNFVPPVFITEFQINNKRVMGGVQNRLLPQDISYTNKITLSYKESTFSFGFAALNYTVSENNQYTYKLEGWDKEWVNAANEKKLPILM